MKPDRSKAIGSGLSRRKFVAGSAAGFATVALAGCAGDEGETETTTTEPEPEDYVVTDDIIVSSSYVPDNAGFAQACSPSRMFAPGMHPVFKIGVYDPATGEHLTDSELDSVVVNIDGYDSVELEWRGEDPDHPAQEWSGSWVIPESAAAGAISYTVEVTDSDANFTSVGILESEFTVIEYSDPLNYVITDDLYTGSAGMGDYGDNAFVSSCQPERQFAPNMMIGFDIGVYEASTGMPVSPEDFEWDESVQGPIESVEVVIESSDDTPGEVEDPVHTVECEWAGYEGEHAEKGEDLYYNGTWHMENEDPPVEPGDYTYVINVTTTGDENMDVVGAAANTFTVVDV